MAETGVGASSASLAHVSSMAASTLDADLMVTDDDADVVGAKHQHACVHQWRLRNAWMLDGGTQWMVLSAAINNPSDAEPLLVHTSIVLLASCTPSMTPAARGVVPEPSGRATGRVLYSGGHGHRVLSIPDQDRPYGRSRWPQPGSPRPYMKMNVPVPLPLRTSRRL